MTPRFSSPRRLFFTLVGILMVMSVFALTHATTTYAGDPSLQFPAPAADTSTDSNIDADKIEPFCGLNSSGGVCFNFENRPAQTDVACVNGNAGGYPCSNVDLEAFVPLSAMNSAQASSLWGWTDEASGREFALVGMTDGTAFVEITNPIAPIFLGKLPTATGTSLWRELKTYSHYAFIVSDSNGAHGIQVFDLNNLLNVTSPPMTFTQSARYTGVGSVHNMVIDTESGFGYAVGSSQCSGGLHMIDLRNPLTPTVAGCYSAASYVHDAQCLTYKGPDVDYIGREICITSDVNQIHVVDVTNKAAPVTISADSYAGFGYIHQSWLTPDGNYMVLDDETDSNPITFIWDMRNLDDPILINTYTQPSDAIDHNQYTKDGFVYQANYRAGMRVLDADNIATGNLTEVGFFDIYPPDDEECFGSAWNVFPYFDSGLVIVSGIEQGLFVLRPTNTQPELTPTPSATNTPTATASATPTNTPSATASATPTNTPSATPSPTNSPTSTSTNTPSTTPSVTATGSMPPATFTPTGTVTNTPTAGPSPTATNTRTPFPTNSATPTSQSTQTPTMTPVASQTPTMTLTPVTATQTPTLTLTPVKHTQTPTLTPVKPTQTVTASATPQDPDATPTATSTPQVPVPTATATTTPKVPIPTATATATPKSPLPTATVTITPTDGEHFLYLPLVQ